MESPRHPPHRPDSSGSTAGAKSSRPRSLTRMLTAFVGVFAQLQLFYQRHADGPIGRFFVETIGTQPAAVLIRTLTPSIDARALGSRIAAPGGGINILSGCEGSEVVFLLVAAFVAVPIAMRARIAGLLLGTVLVLVLNQCRILSLFYAYRADRTLFDQLHTIVTPLALIGITGLFFHAWLRRAARSG